MASTIKITEDNTAPPYDITVKRGTAVIDLTNCTVQLIIAKGSTITNTGHQTCTVVTPTSGLIRYTAFAVDFATPGTYKGDVKVTYGDATVEVIYDQIKWKVRRKLQ